MSKVKHPLRKLHIGGGLNDHQRLVDASPVINPTLSPTPSPNTTTSSSASSSASSSKESSFSSAFDPSNPLGFFEKAFGFVAKESDFLTNDAAEKQIVAAIRAAKEKSKKKVEEIKEVKPKKVKEKKMEIDMPENILGTKFMGFVFITSLMGTATRDRGMNVVSKAMECIRSAMEIQDVANGMVATTRPLCFR